MKKIVPIILVLFLIPCVSFAQGDDSSEESYTMTYDELQEYVMQSVNDDPESYDMVRIEQYEDLQKEFELYEERNPEPEPFGLTEYAIIGAILFALIYSYYLLYKWGADYKAQIGKRFEEGYTKGYENGYYAAEHKEETEKISNILKKQ